MLVIGIVRWRSAAIVLRLWRWLLLLRRVRPLIRLLLKLTLILLLAVASALIVLIVAIRLPITTTAALASAALTISTISSVILAVRRGPTFDVANPSIEHIEATIRLTLHVIQLVAYSR